MVRCIVAIGMVLVVLSASSLKAGEVGVTKDKVVLGTSVPLSGPAAAWGMTAKAMEAYFDYVNEKGGIHGRKIKLLIRDDGYVPSRAVANVKELSDKAFAFIGLLGTAVVSAVRDVITEAKIPIIFAYANVNMWIDYPKEKLRYVFISYPSYIDEGKFLAMYAVDKLGAKTLSVLYQNDDYGKGGIKGVKKAAKEKGVKLAVAVPYEVGETDLSTHAQKLNEAKADALILYATPRHAAMILKETAKLGYKPKVLSTFTVADPIMFKLAGELWNDVYVSGAGKLPGLDPEADRVFKILLERSEEFKKLPNIAMFGANTAMIAVEGLKRAGKDLTREGFIKAMETLKNFETDAGLPVTFTPERRHGSNAVGLLKAKDGKYTRIIKIVEFKPLF